MQLKRTQLSRCEFELARHISRLGALVGAPERPGERLIEQLGAGRRLRLLAFADHFPLEAKSEDPCVLRIFHGRLRRLRCLRCSLPRRLRLRLRRRFRLIRLRLALQRGHTRRRIRRLRLIDLQVTAPVPATATPAEPGARL